MKTISQELASADPKESYSVRFTWDGFVISHGTYRSYKKNLELCLETIVFMMQKTNPDWTYEKLIKMIDDYPYVHKIEKYRSS